MDETREGHYEARTWCRNADMDASGSLCEGVWILLRCIVPENRVLEKRNMSVIGSAQNEPALERTSTAAASFLGMRLKNIIGVRQPGGQSNGRRGR